MISLSQLRVFVAVADSGGIRAAAERIGRTPSAISMALKQFEDEAGGPLFEGERKARLTRFGQFVYDEARSLLAHGDRVTRSITAFSKNGAGNIDAALLPSLAVVFLPETMKRIIVEKPTLGINIRDLDSRSIQEAVSREAVEIGIASYHPASTVTYEALFSEPLNVVCRLDDPLCQISRPLVQQDVADRVFIGNNSYEPLLVPDFLSRSTPQRLHVRSTTSLLALVRAGVGLTILPTLSRHLGSEGLGFLPIADRNAKRTVYLLSNSERGLSPAAQLFADTIKSVIADQGPNYGLSAGVGK